MNTNKLVSVIIPNYNHAKYLDLRIQSVLNQTYDNYEVIILDDKSPDNGASVSVINKYRCNSKVSHIIINEENSGSTFKQWQKGFDFAKGDYIWIAESDDFCETNFLETLMTEALNHPSATLLFAKSQRVNSEGKMISPIESEKRGFIAEFLHLSRTRLFDGRQFVLRYMAIGNGIPNASACILKKSVLRNIPQDYMDYKAAGDKLFWIYIALCGNVIRVETPLNYFRQHDNKVTPKKFYEGVTPREDYDIYCHLKNNLILSGWRLHLTGCFYLNLIYKSTFASEEIKQSLIDLWKKDVNHSQSYVSKACKLIHLLHKLHIPSV